MFIFYLIANLVIILIGLIRIEDGDLGGFHNYSIYPYLLYLLCIFIAYNYSNFRQPTWIKKSTFKDLRVTESSSDNQVGAILIQKNMHGRIRFRILVAFIILILIILYSFNGIDVLSGDMRKGEFRSQMGYWGFLLAIPIKFLIPAFFTRICFGYYNNIRLGGKALLDKWFLLFFILCIAAEISNGDKSMAITTVFCGFIALLWKRTKFKHLFLFGIFSISIIVLLSSLFDRNVQGGNLWTVLDYIGFRTFSLSAESSWKIWELYTRNELTFNYPITLASILGSGGIEFFFGVGKYDGNSYMFYFARQVTALLYPSKIPLINAGVWNITPSAYVEGLLMGGIPGIMLFGFFVGWLSNYIKNKITKSIFMFDYAKSSAFIVYFVFAFIPWIQSGGITTLIHPITLGGVFSSYYLIKWMEKKITF